MFKQEAKGTDYRGIDTDYTFTRIIVHVRVKAGQTLKLRVRARWCMVDWGDGELKRDLVHTYMKGGRQNVNIVGNRVNWLNVEGWNAVELYLDRCPFLTRLRCQGNRLTKLNLIHCPSLVYVDCSYNRLEYMQVANLKKLKEVKANNNSLRVVDFSDCSQLQDVDLSGNGVFATITRGCRKLKNLWCDYAEFNPEDYKEMKDDEPALIINEGEFLTIKGDKELMERGKRIVERLKAGYKK